MSRSTRHLLAAALVSVAVVLAVVVAVAAPPSRALSATPALDPTPSPSPSATPPLRVLVKAGGMTLLTDPGQSKELFAGGAAPLGLAPAGLQLTDDAWRFAFPLRGNLNPVSLAASISPRGGFEFWGRQTMSAWTVLSFAKLRVTLGAKSTVSAVFDTTLGRHTIMALDLSKRHVTHFTKGGRRWVRISNIGATMSDWLVKRLTAAFPTYAPANDTLGTITVTLRIG